MNWEVAKARGEVRISGTLPEGIPGMELQLAHILTICTNTAERRLKGSPH